VRAVFVMMDSAGMMGVRMLVGVAVIVMVRVFVRVLIRVFMTLAGLDTQRPGFAAQRLCFNAQWRVADVVRAGGLFVCMGQGHPQL